MSLIIIILDKFERRHTSPSATPIATRVAEVQMRAYSQDEIESHHQELQQSFLSCGSFLQGQEPCGYFQWLHGPLWRLREHAQPSLRRWVKEIPHGMYPITMI